ncbi:ATP-binding protein [Streptomyces sp. B-S-A8]|uniref:ATP-binding protein n=1 Tax=Streptomyces solicavernae TaxID=3043614 RepID=A0ABT6RKL0_9ACTN|nr:ATP-binding protein [Streptomyces sp. B-S-A8]MDI3384972.1 ATP-binding protein [Streptomyces sp. B-S-A8]
MPTGCSSTYAGAAFEGRTDSAVHARNLVSEFVAQLRASAAFTVPAEALGAALLVVTELVTNVVKHASGPCVLELELAADALEITVWDTEPALPVMAAPDALRPSRHGLEIVHALSRAVTVEQRAGGKRICASVPLG